jgi:uroporphyrinogen decarboxylase
MNSRERITAALSHREADRIPIDLGGTMVTSITRAAYLPLRKHLGLPDEPVVVSDLVQQLPYLGEDLLDRLGSDVRAVLLPPEMVQPPELIDEGDYWGWVDPWGAKLLMPKGSGLYFDWVGHPLADLTDESLDQYRWPAFESTRNLAAMREQALNLRKTTDFALAGTASIGGGIFEQACRLVGTEQFMMAMLTDRAVADRLLEQLTEHYIEAVTRQLEAFGEFLDVVQYGDDLASQQTWLISPDTYVAMVKPRQRRLFEAVRSRTSAKLMFHSCGAIFDVIPHLIDIGVDVVNPVQVSARGMGTARLKAAYGRDIVFWGGGVDTQGVLPFGTEDDVRAEVIRRIEDLAPGGGFVWAPVHNVQAGVPPENTVAAFDTARSYRL